MYYDQPAQWFGTIKASLHDVVPYFDSDRMATEYIETLYALFQPVGQSNELQPA